MGTRRLKINTKQIHLTSKSIGICKTVDINTFNQSMESILKFIIPIVMEDRVTEVTVVIRAIPDMVMKSHLTEDMNLLMEAINHLIDLILPVQQAKKKASQKETLTYTSSVLTTPMNFFNHDHEYTSSELI